MLTPRWTQMAFHAEQQRFFRSTKRFCTVPCGRRSGKTELSKRKVILKAFEPVKWRDPRYFMAAPTFTQAKRIFWNDLKALIPQKFRYGKPSESELIMRLITGAEICIIGLDKPERMEGQPWNGGVITEFPNVKKRAWLENIRPALMDRHGWCILEGVPEGRNHYYLLDKVAKMEAENPEGEWDSFHWTAEEVLPLYGMESEVQAARRDMDELTYLQEMQAEFVNFTGRAYYNYFENTHAKHLKYDPHRTLILCFDFNVEPGVAVICQEQTLPNGLEGTGIIGEVYIPRNSNTVAVCKRIIKDWGNHKGYVMCYGDASGGARKSSQTSGSDWDLIKQLLIPVFDRRLWFEIPSVNPSERSRINTVNSRLKSANGDIKMMIDLRMAPQTAFDLEGVKLLEGGSGEIDKADDPKLSHLTDALGYYIVKEFPVYTYRSSGSQQLIHARR